MDIYAGLAARMEEAQRAMNQNIAEQIYGDDWATGLRKPEPKLRRVVRKVRWAIGGAVFKAACFVAGEDRWSGDW